MSSDYLSIGATPCGEDCAQVGSNNYSARVKRECAAFINQLRRQFGPEPEFASLRIKAFSHDFGTYYEVVCYFNDEDSKSVDYAFDIENNSPELWDEQAREELGIVV